MTLKVDKKGKFEERYVNAFEARARQRGILLTYDRDQAAIDRGLHLTAEIDDYYEGVTNTRVWFQFKGQGEKTTSREKFDAATHVAVSVEIDHLRQWYKDSDPVYLVVYVEAANDFFAVDVRELVDSRWGDRVFKDETFVKRTGAARPVTVKVHIPKAARVDDKFWERLRGHRSMRADGASFRGVPLAHSYDFRSRRLKRMDPALFAEVVNDLLASHGYKIKITQDAYQLYTGSHAAGDAITLSVGTMFEPYEFIPYMTPEQVPDEEGFRAEGQTFTIHGKCAVLIHNYVVSRPDPAMLKELFESLAKEGVSDLLVFVNHYFLGSPLTGERAYNCFPEFSSAAAGTGVSCVPQHLEDLGRNILLATNVYLKYRERLPWLDDEFDKGLESGELTIL